MRVCRAHDVGGTRGLNACCSFATINRIHLKIAINWGQVLAAPIKVVRSSGSEETKMRSVGAVFQPDTKAGIRHLHPVIKWQTRSDLLENDDRCVLDHGLSGPQVIGRVLFSCASTLLTALCVYLAIRSLVGP